METMKRGPRKDIAGLERRRREWDWTRNDADLARLYGLSRERVRQIRKALDMPPSPRTGRCERKVAAVLPQFEGMGVRATARALNVSHSTIERLAKKYDVKVTQRAVRKDWNWDIPTSILARIYKVRPQDVNNARAAYGRPPRWSVVHLPRRNRRPVEADWPEDLKAAVAAEIRRAS